MAGVAGKSGRAEMVSIHHFVLVQPIGRLLTPHLALKWTRPQAGIGESVGLPGLRSAESGRPAAGDFLRRDVRVTIRFMLDLREVDPRELRLPSGRGVDPYKLQRQIARFGSSSSGMPPPWVYEASDGILVL